MTKTACTFTTLLTAGLFLFPALTQAQSGASPGMSSGELYREIAAMDSVLFTAFNGRDLATVKTIFAEDLEFYHDTGGLGNYEQNIEATARLFSRDNDLWRELVDGSLEVYPLPGYGALQVGAHRFCHTENGSQDCGTFKFVHIWRLVNGSWKLARVVSYGH